MSEKGNINKTINIILLLVLLVIAFLFGINKFFEINKGHNIDLAERNSIDKICELATLRCYYHNVVEFEDQPDIFKYGVYRYGYKKFFFEYSGIVEVGVEAGDVRIGQPERDGTIKVYVPEAKILNISADNDSITEPVKDTGWMTTITTDDIATAFSTAQQEMKEEANSDKIILKQARDNAKELVKQFIINTGNLFGKTYTVKWVDEPI